MIESHLFSQTTRQPSPTDHHRARLGFFAHHHGNGHLARCSSIAKSAKLPSVVFSARERDDAPRGRVHHVVLPCDDWGKQGRLYQEHEAPTPQCFHHAPLGVRGIRQRAQVISSWILGADPLALVVDVSVEVTLLARLCSVPAIVMRMHGNRNDPAHLEAYRSAAYLIAPFAECMEQTDTPAWVRKKTFYAGGISRCQNLVKQCVKQLRRRHDKGEHDQIALMVTGHGGEALALSDVAHIAKQSPSWSFLVAGRVREDRGVELPDNVTVLGFVPDVLEYIQLADVVIGSAGDNLVMEVAWADKPFICIPAYRPFDEQLIKASLLARHRLATSLPHLDTTRNWNDLLDRARQEKGDWGVMQTQGATERAASFLSDLIHKERYVYND